MEERAFRDIVIEGINFEELEERMISAGWKRPEEEMEA